MRVIVLSRKKLIVVALILIMVVLASCFLSVGFLGAFNGKKRKLPIYYVDTPEKKIAISFDCAWGVEYTDTLLKIMGEESVKCTFFMVEFWTNKYPDYVKKIDDCGHEIGTHSSTHPYMSKLSKQAIIKELTSSSDAITKITDKKVKVFRPPYGDYNDLLINSSLELGLYPIQWDVDSLDWKNLSAKEIENRVLDRVKNGSIVLFHNNGLNTAKALTPIIKELKSRGYTFVPVGDLIYTDNYEILHDGKQVKL